MKKLLAGAAMLLTISAINAAEPPSKKEFMADEARRAQFEKAQQAGMMAGARKQLLAECEANTLEADKKQYCGCFKERLDALSDEDLFYESVIAYEWHVKKVEAKAANDGARFAELDRQQKSASSMQDIDKSCKR